MTDNDNPVFRKISEKNSEPSRDLYRHRINTSMKYTWRLVHRYSDLLISSNTDVISRIRQLVHDFYHKIDKIISCDPAFLKSLAPVKVKQDYPVIIKKMCLAAGKLNVGPMASVAGAVCDYISDGLSSERCGDLIIENGGDLYLRSTRDLNVGLYIIGSRLNDNLYLKIKRNQTPCGLCSSSGRFGHSMSLGKSDLVTVMGESTIIADAAATAVANAIKNEKDIEKAIAIYRIKKGIKGILIVKENRIGLWGNIQLKA